MRQIGIWKATCLFKDNYRILDQLKITSSFLETFDVLFKTIGKYKLIHFRVI